MTRWRMFDIDGKRVGTGERWEAERALANRWCASIAPDPVEQLTLFGEADDDGRPR